MFEKIKNQINLKNKFCSQFNCSTSLTSIGRKHFLPIPSVLHYVFLYFCKMYIYLFTTDFICYNRSAVNNKLVWKKMFNLNEM